MPTTKKDRKILSAMQRQYGTDKGKEVFYRSINKGRIHGTGTTTERKRKHTR